jgi:hypothetical protein
MRLSFIKIFTIKTKERNLFFEAFITGFKIRIKILFCRFSKYSSDFGKASQYSININDDDIHISREIVISIKRASNISPFRYKCMEQALTAKKMLFRRGIVSTVFFGVNKPGEKMSAHAWLKAGEMFVIGEKNHELFTIVAFYT